MVSLQINDKALPSFRFALFKTVSFVIILAILLLVVTYIFGWSSTEGMPTFLLPYSNVIFAVNNYLKFVETGLIFVFGYVIINSISGMVYSYAMVMAEQSTAMTFRTLIRILGIALLLALMTSIFNVDPSAALTVGSFGGLIVGYATQNVMSHVIAGTFLLITRPFTFGDTIKVADQIGRVKEIKLMHVILETDDSSEDILIPSGTIVSQIIHRRKTKTKRINKTMIEVENLPLKVRANSTIIFKGKLIQKNGQPLSNKKIKLFEIDLTNEELLASAATNETGVFEIKWKVKKTDPIDNTAELHFVFEGDENNRACVSETHSIIIN